MSPSAVSRSGARKNERGLVRLMLGIQAAFERMAVRRARVVVATSGYSRDRIMEAYGIPAAKVVLVPEPIDLRGWELERKPIPVREADPPAVLTVTAYSAWSTSS